MSLKDGNNSIIINGAANCHYDKDISTLCPAWTSMIQQSKFMILQREIPEFVNVIAARIAREAGTKVILDVGGRDEPLTHELLQYLDILSPNETELERVIGKKANSKEEVEEEIFKLVQKYPQM